MIITYKLVIALIISFVLVWLFVKTIDKRKWLTLLLTIVLSPILYFYLFYPLLNIFSSYHHEKYFDAQQWIKKPSSRYEMINDMVSNKILIGKTKAEIQTLLGKYEWLSWDKALNAKSKDKWNYNLGLKPGALNKKMECMELNFNNAQVTALRRYQMEEEFE